MTKKLDDYKLSAVMVIIVNAPCGALTLICAVTVQCAIRIWRNQFLITLQIYKKYAPQVPDNFWSAANWSLLSPDMLRLSSLRSWTAARWSYWMLDWCEAWPSHTGNEWKSAVVDLKWAPKCNFRIHFLQFERLLNGPLAPALVSALLIRFWLGNVFVLSALIVSGV